LAIFSKASFALRRIFLIAIRASSAFALATLINSLRRSSVSCGKGTRTIAPSFDGLTPLQIEKTMEILKHMFKNLAR
jgi:hypothetical protein